MNDIKKIEKNIRLIKSIIDNRKIISHTKSSLFLCGKYEIDYDPFSLEESLIEVDINYYTYENNYDTGKVYKRLHKFNEIFIDTDGKFNIYNNSKSENYTIMSSKNIIEEIYEDIITDSLNLEILILRYGRSIHNLKDVDMSDVEILNKCNGILF